MTYNRQDIMRKAWAENKARNEAYAAKGWTRRDPFKSSLYTVWQQVKREVAEAKRAAEKAEWERVNLPRQTITFPNTELGKVEKAIFTLEMKDCWTDSDYALSEKLHAEKRQIENAA